MRINTNIASINIYNEYSKNLVKQSAALEQISSGVKINSAKDDPNGLAESERFQMQIRGLQMASTNSQDGVSMLQTAEGGLDGVTSSLQRVRELLVQAGGATTDSDKADIQSEINQSLSGANDMANNTDFNGVKLLNAAIPVTVPPVVPVVGKSTDSIEMVTGANVGDKVDIPKYDLTSNGLGLKSTDAVTGDVTNNIDVNNVAGSLTLVDNAISAVVSARSKFGALENRFQTSYNSTIAISDKTQAAESGITDTDMAGEMIKYSTDNILIQAGIAMMVQSNQLPQDALKILENVSSK